MGSRQLSSRFTVSRWVILLNGFLTIVQQIFTGSRKFWVILLNGFQTIVQQIHRESPGYSSQRVLDYCSVDSLGVAGLFFSTGSRLLYSRLSGSRWVILLNGFQTIVQQRFTGSRWVILLNGFQTIVQQIHRESLGYSSQRVLDYCQVDSQGVAGLFGSTGSRLLSSRFTESRWIILLNGFQTIVQQIHRKSLGYSSRRVLDYCQVDSQGVAGYSSQRFLDYCPVEIHRESLGYSSKRVLDYCPVDIYRESLGYSSQRVVDYCPVDIHSELLGFFSQRILDYCRVDSQGAAGLFFLMGSRQLSSRFTGSRWVILLNGFLKIVQQIFTGSRWVILLNGFQTIVQQIHRESPGYSSQRVLDYCSVDSLGVAGLFFSTGSRLLYSRLSGSRWVILLNGFYTIVQQIFTGSRCVILLNGFQTIVQQIHRESLGYSSQRVLDYCQVDSQGVAGLFFSTGSRQLSSRFTGSRWVILPNGFQTIVQQIHRESLVYSSQRVLDYCSVVIHRESLGYSSRRVLDYCQQIHRESPGYSSQRVLDYCSVDSQGAAGLFFSMGSRQLSSRFTGSRWVILLNGFLTIVQQRFTGSRWVFFLNGFQTIAKQIHREPLGYSSQWVQDNCPADSQGVAGLFFSTDSRLLSSRYSQGVVGLFFSTGSRLLSSRFTGSRRVILLSGFQTIVQQIHWESLGYSSQQVLDYCPVDIHREALIILLNGFQAIVQQRFTGSRWVFFLNGFSTIVEQIHREQLGYSSQWVQDNCPVDSQGVAGLFFSTDS